LQLRLDVLQTPAKMKTDIDCSSPMILLASMSVRKQAESGNNNTADHVDSPNFDDFSESPKSSIGQHHQLYEALFLSSEKKSLVQASAPQSPEPVKHFEAAHPAVETSRAGQLDFVKCSPRIDVLVQAAKCSDKQKKKRQPPNPEKKSKYRGVSWQKTSRAWVAQYKSSGKTTYLGLFGTEEEAARAYDVALFLKGGKNLNFGPPAEEVVNQFRANGNVPPGRLGATVCKRPDEPPRKPKIVEMSEADSAAASAAQAAKADKGATSHYRGVSWYAARQIWKASIQVNRKKEYIGRFQTEEEAARAYNKRAIELRGQEAILNVVPNTRTRFPPGEPPKPIDELKAVKRARPNNKRPLDVLVLPSTTVPTLADTSSAGAAAFNFQEWQVKKLKSDKSKEAILSTLAPIPPTPQITLLTPTLSRSIENENGNLTLPKPSFDEDEGVGFAVSDRTFDSPLFTSPIPVGNKRIGQTAPSSLLGPLSDGPFNNGSLTPMFQNIFDSPLMQYDAVSFTPLTTGPRRFDALSTVRRGRKSLTAVPYT